jgi:hypothetical protein
MQTERLGTSNRELTAFAETPIGDGVLFAG